MVSSLPDEVPVEVVMEMHRDSDRELPFPSRPQMRITWVPSRADDRALLNALQNHDYRGWHTWVAAEMKATRLVRSNLRSLHDQNRSTMHATAYWVRGRAMGRKLDVPSEENPSSESRVTTPNARVSAAPETDSASAPSHDPLHNTDLSHSHPQNQFEGVGSPTTDATGTSQSNDSTTLEVNQPNSLPKTRVTLIACGIAAALITTVLLLHHKVH
ncbi:SIP domain-containing protein [Corynebacterium parakroppenstedtii]|uniref:SIP domain-containing protein n=1 Tax=Corynebacterium parakroppenstedtii TaxID=2828363 RepID=UPI001EEFF286|nr:siderophore-interacting protein [Corynebacterium parakroppenstedtii]MCF8700246.1 siderophore-interacting protein [Corynebacterium parakroppenstedtii]